MAFEITFERMVVFFLILCIGFSAGKLSIITRDYLPQFAKLITKIFLPVMIFLVDLPRNDMANGYG